MKCPHCQKELTEGRDPDSHIAYHKCHECHGVLADYNKLSQKINEDELKKLFSVAPTRLHTGNKCPKCQEEFQEVTFDPDKTCLQLDICHDCQCIWFDFLEYARLKKSTAHSISSTKEKELDLLKASFEISQQNKINKIKEHNSILQDLSEAAHRVFHTLF